MTLYQVLARSNLCSLSMATTAVNCNEETLRTFNKQAQDSSSSSPRCSRFLDRQRCHEHRQHKYEPISDVKCLFLCKNLWDSSSTNVKIWTIAIKHKQLTVRIQHYCTWFKVNRQSPSSNKRQHDWADNDLCNSRTIVKDDAQPRGFTPILRNQSQKVK